MYGTIAAGERRLPGDDDAGAGGGAPVAGALALTPINIGTIPAGRSVTIQWDSVVDSFGAGIVPTHNNASTVTGNNPGAFTVNSNIETLSPTSAPLALDSLVLGNLIFLDANNNGIFDAGDSGIDGVALTLFVDTNANNMFDAGTDTQVATATTAGGGLYNFVNLAAGDYIVRVDAANFTGGGALVGRITATGGSDPDNNVDNDDNGVSVAGGIVVSQAITLAHNTETTADGTGQLDINNTLDLGFADANDAPVNTVPGTQTINEDGSLTFSSGNGNLISVADSDAGAGNVTVTLSVLHGVLTLSGTTGLSFGAGDGTDDATMTFTGTLTNVNNALNGLLYEPNPNFNVTETLTITSNDNGNTGADPGLTGGPGNEQDTDNVTITVNAVNDAPTVVGDGTEQAADIETDTPSLTGQTVSSLFSGQYSDAADAQFGVGNPERLIARRVHRHRRGRQRLQRRHRPVAVFQYRYLGLGRCRRGRAEQCAADRRGHGDPLQSGTGFTGAAPTLTVHLIDNSLGFAITFGQFVNISGVGATGGTTPYSTGQVVLSQQVNTPNDPPTLDLDADDSSAAGTGYAGSYTENDNVGVVIADSDTEITDPNAGDNIESATITISNFVTGDELILGPVGAGFTVHGSGTGQLTITGTGTADEYEAFIEQILFRNTGDDPTDLGAQSTRTIDVVVNDGQDDSATAQAVISITTDDDPAVANNTSITTDEATPIARRLTCSPTTIGTRTMSRTLTMTELNISAGAVGSQITLASGALLTVNSRRQLRLRSQRRLRCDSGPRPALRTSAPAGDSFTYTISGGDTATVTFKINGLDTDDTLFGASGDDTLNGGMGNDTIFVADLGDVVVETSGGGDDLDDTSVDHLRDDVERLVGDGLSTTFAVDLPATAASTTS